MNSENKERLVQIFKESFPSFSEAPVDEILDATTESVQDWESITTLNLLMIIEAEFGITISDEVAATEFNSYLSIESYIDTLDIE